MKSLAVTEREKIIILMCLRPLPVSVLNSYLGTETITDGWSRMKLMDMSVHYHTLDLYLKTTSTTNSEKGKFQTEDKISKQCFQSY